MCKRTIFNEINFKKKKQNSTHTHTLKKNTQKSLKIAHRNLFFFCKKKILKLYIFNSFLFYCIKNQMNINKTTLYIYI
jgi:hypothetical protein